MHPFLLNKHDITILLTILGDRSKYTAFIPSWIHVCIRDYYYADVLRTESAVAAV